MMTSDVMSDEPLTNKSKQTSKKHHHVPVWYLKRWAGEDGKVHVVRKINSQIVRNNHAPEHIGFERHLYSYDGDFPAEDRAEIETKFFKPLDSEGARIVEIIISGRELEKRDRVLWTQFLTSMKIRTPENVERIKSEYSKRLIQEIASRQSNYEKIRTAGDPKTAVEYLELKRPGFVNSIGVSQLPKIASNSNAMQGILSFSWHVVNFERSPNPLLASDRPCVYTRGLDHSDCVIVLPLSPRHAFFAFRPDSKVDDALKSMPLKQLAAGINAIVVSQAADRAYIRSPSDAPDNFFDKYLRPSKMNSGTK